MNWLSLLFGMIVGLSLGLTGGGGAIFAVPLLVYGMEVAPRDAVGISLAAVGATALVGFLARWKLGQVEISTGLLLAAAGMIGAPVGAWIGSLLPEPLLLVLFAVLMVVIAILMWQKASPPDVMASHPVAVADEQVGPTCRRDASGVLLVNSPCAILLFGMGIAIGILSGLFGVGGGFVIVPVLVLFSSMPIHRAVGTSLLVIALVSVSGVSSHIWHGQSIPLVITSLFVLGGIVGLFAGQQIGSRLPAAQLQKGFAVVILAVAAFVLLRSFSQ